MTYWWQYRSDTPGSGAYGGIEPQCPGCYAKPDTNIAVPAGTPITALMPGVITDVENRGAFAGGLSVTERLTNALNSVAQYMSFNFLGGTSVYKGESVSAGQQVGTAGSPTGTLFALGLGADPVWGTTHFSQYQGDGSPLTNPQKLVLDPLLAGKSLGGGNVTPGPTVDCSFCNQLGPMAVPCLAACNAGSAAGTQFGSNLAPQQVAVYGQLGHIMQNLTTPSFWVRVGIGAAAIVLIVMALLYFVKDTAPAKGAEHTVEKSAMVAAV
jgi:hypothetical protein